MSTIRTYHELIQLPTFEERFRYLKLGGSVGEETFGWERWINQKFYSSPEWKSLRNRIIIRDNGCDLGVADYEIHGRVIIHHIEPVTPSALSNGEEYWLLNPDNLICVSHNTHNAIHYGDEDLLPKAPVERTPNDTCPWRRV